MSLELVLHRSIYSLVLVACTTLALAEGTPSPTYASPLIVVLAYFLHERSPKLTLSNFAAGMWGVTGFGLALAELSTGDIEARILSGAHLLTYILWVVLFMRKRQAQWWWVIAIGVLQIAIASVLKPGGWFGPVLFLFSIMSVWTLSVFSMFRAARQFRRVQKFAVVSSEGGVQADPAWWLSSQSAESTAGATSRAKRADSSQPVSQSRGVIQRDPHESWISPRFVGSTLACAVGTLALSLVLFALVPRLGWQRLGTKLMDEKDEAVQLSGFTDEVHLGDMANILQSTERVLTIKVLDAETGQHVDVREFTRGLGYEEPLFRGTVLGDYRNGTWTKADPGGGIRAARRTYGKHPHYVQLYKLEPIAGRILFAVHPMKHCSLVSTGDGVGIHTTRGVLFQNAVATESTQYRVISEKLQAVPRNAQPFPEDGLSPEAKSLYLQVPRGLNKLVEEARRVVELETNPSQQARIDRLLNYLRRGSFQYSLELTRSNLGIDPVEDFVFNHKTGHCEYFASSMVLMLRAAGVPARLVSGFKGGNYSEETKTLTIQQLHAHAWVEALSEVDGSERWIVLDPTPGDEQTELAEAMSSRTPAAWESLSQFVSRAWDEYILNVNLSKQRRLFFDPIRDTFLDIWDTINESGLVIGLLRLILKLVTDPSTWFSWQGWILTFVLLFMLSGVLWVFRRIWRTARAFFFPAADQARQRKQIVAFYARFRSICEQLRLVPQAGQTPREFAADVRRTISRLLPTAGLEQFPEFITETFYAVRFGERKLAPVQLAEIDRSLSQLERCLHGPASPAQ